MSTYYRSIGGYPPPNSVVGGGEDDFHNMTKRHSLVDFDLIDFSPRFLPCVEVLLCPVNMASCVGDLRNRIQSAVERIHLDFRIIMNLGYRTIYRFKSSS